MIEIIVSMTELLKKNPRLIAFTGKDLKKKLLAYDVLPNQTNELLPCQ